MFVPLIRSTLEFAPPTVLAACGGVVSERAGVVNIALEAMMRFGAFFGVVGAYFWPQICPSLPGVSPWFGLLCGMIAGGVLGFAHAYVCVTWCGNQIVSGVALNIFAIGSVTFMLELIFGKTGISEKVPHPFHRIECSYIDSIPLLGEILGKQHVFTFLAVIIPILLHFFVYRTVWGLRLRAAGEHPLAVATVGVRVEFIRYCAVIISGMLAGMGGVSLSVASMGHFADHMPAGRGFIALAAVVFGKWTPLGAFGAAMLFTFFEGLGHTLQSMWPDVPKGVFPAMPYILTLLVLAGFVGKAVPPSALGVPYMKEER